MAVLGTSELTRRQKLNLVGRGFSEDRQGRQPSDSKASLLGMCHVNVVLSAVVCQLLMLHLAERFTRRNAFACSDIIRFYCTAYANTFVICLKS